MVLTVFRSRIRPEALEEYLRWAGRMATLARETPGYISHKGLQAEDGERVTIVEFESEDAQRAWAMHPGHLTRSRRICYLCLRYKPLPM
jgi:heme-degrading monooxygenase HmoA